METLVTKSRVFENGEEGFEFFGSQGNGTESASSDSATESRGRSGLSSSGSATSHRSLSPAALGWPIQKAKCSTKGLKEDQPKSNLDDSNNSGGFWEVEMVKERFSKLLLGEDMSGSGKGACPALAISNTITNLCATVFGQLWRLEPLRSEKKLMWQREMEWLLCTTDHIVELVPSWQTLPDGRKVEVMTCRPRSDLVINIPALCKLDNILLEILDSFNGAEFWYIDRGIIAADADGSTSFCKPIQRQEEKWWLPVPRVPPGGLCENSRKQLHRKRDCTNQILKAAMAINSAALADMEVPESYLETLPKNGRACLGDVIYRYITSDHFSSECLLDCLDLSSEHIALEIANRVEASIYVWRRRTYSKPITNPNRSATKSSWEIVKELMVDGDKRELLAERAEGLLHCLKLRFPGLTQTTLDTSKIQCNKDVGKSILESYSRVLESLAFNIVARIDDLLYVDDLTRHSEKKLSSVPTMISVVAHKKSPIPCAVPISSTANKTTLTAPSCPPVPTISPSKGERTPLLISNKPHRRGFGVKRVLTNYMGGEAKVKNRGNPKEGADSVSNTKVEVHVSQTAVGSLKESSSACKRV